jgi:ACR3 family arsenite efflux pump ArsB
MSFLAKFQPFFIIASALLGILLGKAVPVLERPAGTGIEVFLTGMLFFVFLNVPLKEISKSFSDMRFSISALLLNFMVTPLFAFGLSRAFFPGQIDGQIGFIMLLATPCTDWYLIFTGSARGNVSLGASILPLNLLLQIILLPIYLLLFLGAEVSFDIFTILRSIVFVLMIPLVSANIVKYSARKTNRQDRLAKVLEKADDLQCILLCLAILSMFASQGALLLDNTGIFVKITPALLLFFAVIFCLALGAGKLLRLPFRNIVSLIFTASARNSPISLAIAAVTFPSQPVIALVLVMGPLIELPVLAVYAALLRRFGNDSPAV